MTATTHLLKFLCDLVASNPNYPDDNDIPSGCRLFWGTNLLEGGKNACAISTLWKTVRDLRLQVKDYDAKTRQRCFGTACILKTMQTSDTNIVWVLKLCLLPRRYHQHDYLNVFCHLTLTKHNYLYPCCHLTIKQQ